LLAEAVQNQVQGDQLEEMVIELLKLMPTDALRRILAKGCDS
jgi:hypothetical protein